MSFVIDSNILFTYFWKDSFLRSAINKDEFSLFSPEFALKEIDKHKNYIIKKAKISEKEFNIMRLEMLSVIKFAPQEFYSSVMTKTQKIILNLKLEEKETRELFEDSEFIALALKLDYPLWTHDKLIKEIKGIDVLNTLDMIKLLG